MEQFSMFPKKEPLVLVEGISQDPNAYTMPGARQSKIPCLEPLLSTANLNCQEEFWVNHKVSKCRHECYPL